MNVRTLIHLLIDLDPEAEVGHLSAGKLYPLSALVPSRDPDVRLGLMTKPTQALNVLRLDVVSFKSKEPPLVSGRKITPAAKKRRKKS